MGEQEYIVTRTAVDGSCIMYIDSKELKGMNRKDIEQYVIEKAISLNEWVIDNDEPDDTVGIDYSVDEQ